LILSVTQVLQEIPMGGRWETMGDGGIGEGIGVAMADTLMWQRHPGPWLQGAYGMLLPLVERGIPVSSVVLERAKEVEYLNRFSVIVLCYEDFKPLDATMNDSIAAWVRAGGSLVVLGKDGDELDRCENFWWHEKRISSPLAHLLSLLEGGNNRSSWKVGAGNVIRSEVSPRTFGNSAMAKKDYLPLVESAWKQSTGKALVRPGNLVMRRGPFVIARAETQSVKLSGMLLDVFDPLMRLADGAELAPGQSALYRDVRADLAAGAPKVLHATHRLMNQSIDNGMFRFTVRGPAETPAAVRIVWPRNSELRVAATDPADQPVTVDVVRHDDTALLRFANHPQGVAVSCQGSTNPSSDISAAMIHAGIANEGFGRCHRYVQAWLSQADPISGLIPRNFDRDRDIWNGRIHFDRPRWKDWMHLPIDWPRINQFPQWFTAETGKSYEITLSPTNQIRVYDGADLVNGIPIESTTRQPLTLHVKPVQ
jgi:hypothetical protein